MKNQNDVISDTADEPSKKKGKEINSEGLNVNPTHIEEKDITEVRRSKRGQKPETGSGDIPTKAKKTKASIKNEGPQNKEVKPKKEVMTDGDQMVKSLIRDRPKGNKYIGAHVSIAGL